MATNTSIIYREIQTTSLHITIASVIACVVMVILIAVIMYTFIRRLTTCCSDSHYTNLQRTEIEPGYSTINPTSDTMSDEIQIYQSFENLAGVSSHCSGTLTAKSATEKSSKVLHAVDSARLTGRVGFESSAKTKIQGHSAWLTNRKCEVETDMVNDIRTLSSCTSIGHEYEYPVDTLERDISGQSVTLERDISGQSVTSSDTYEYPQEQQLKLSKCANAKYEFVNTKNIPTLPTTSKSHKSMPISWIGFQSSAKTKTYKRPAQVAKLTNCELKVETDYNMDNRSMTLSTCTRISHEYEYPSDKLEGTMSCQSVASSDIYEFPPEKHISGANASQGFIISKTMPKCERLRTSSKSKISAHGQHSTSNDNSEFRGRSITLDSQGYMIPGSRHNQSTFIKSENVILSSENSEECDSDSTVDDYIIPNDYRKWETLPVPPQATVVIPNTSSRKWESLPVPPQATVVIPNTSSSRFSNSQCLFSPPLEYRNLLTLPRDLNTKSANTHKTAVSFMFVKPHVPKLAQYDPSKDAQGSMESFIERRSSQATVLGQMREWVNRQ